MLESSKSTLDELLAAKASRENEAAKAQRIAQERTAAFLDRFKALCQQEVRPVMDEFARRLEEDGIKVVISNFEPIPGQPSLMIAIKLGPQHRHNHEYPNFRVSCDKALQRITFFKSTIGPGRSGRSGADGNADIAEVNAALIETKIVALLKEVLS